MTHSKAPWRWERPPQDDCYEGPLDRLVAADGTEVCNFGDSTEYYPSCGSAPAEADRLLIESAPELLEALEERVAAFWGDWINLPEKYRESFRRDYPDHSVMKAEQLIKRIKGESS